MKLFMCLVGQEFVVRLLAASKGRENSASFLAPSWPVSISVRKVVPCTRWMKGNQTPADIALLLSHFVSTLLYLYGFDFNRICFPFGSPRRVALAMQASNMSNLIHVFAFGFFYNLLTFFFLFLLPFFFYLT